MRPNPAPSSASTPARPSNRAGMVRRLPRRRLRVDCENVLTFTVPSTPPAGKQHRSRATVSARKSGYWSRRPPPYPLERQCTARTVSPLVQRLASPSSKEHALPRPPHGQGPRARRPHLWTQHSASPSRPTASRSGRPPLPPLARTAGLHQLGILGTSIGSSVGYITLVHDERISAGGFFHVSTYYATSSARE